MPRALITSGYEGLSVLIWLNISKYKLLHVCALLALSMLCLGKQL